MLELIFLVMAVQLFKKCHFICCCVIKWSLTPSKETNVTKIIHCVCLIIHACLSTALSWDWLNNCMCYFPFCSNSGSFSGCPICPSLADWIVPRCWRWHHHVVVWKTEVAMKPGRGELTLFLLGKVDSTFARGDTLNQVRMGLCSSL